jgi:hypothetical protein
MNLSGSANIFLNFWTAVTLFSPLLSEMEPIFAKEKKVQPFKFVYIPNGKTALPYIAPHYALHSIPRLSIKPTLQIDTNDVTRA